jgi:hypothetical protein
MANSFGLGWVGHDSIVGSGRSDSNVADMQNRGNDTEKIELFGRGEANCIQCTLAWMLCPSRWIK